MFSLRIYQTRVEANLMPSSNMSAVNKQKLGWEPVWDKEGLLTNIDDEIDAVLELGQAKSSLIGSLFDAAKG